MSIGELAGTRIVQGETTQYPGAQPTLAQYQKAWAEFEAHDVEANWLARAQQHRFTGVTDPGPVKS